ncbi:MAG: hypothetical protein OXF95_07725 [Rhodobacteraceae bacterium]|nr:hypothetical protein [Paracoccaceae bacterium]
MTTEKVGIQINWDLLAIPLPFFTSLVSIFFADGLVNILDVDINRGGQSQHFTLILPARWRYIRTEPKQDGRNNGK